MAGTGGAGKVAAKKGLSGDLLVLPLTLGSGALAARMGEHWVLTPHEALTLSQAGVGVLDELLPMIPVLDDSPLAKAVTALVVALGTVAAPRLYLTYLQTQAAREVQAEDAHQVQHAQQFGIGGLQV